VVHVPTAWGWFYKQAYASQQQFIGRAAETSKEPQSHTYTDSMEERN